MHHRPNPAAISVNRTVDLRGIDAVGFDLDHTLALYDDDAVNALAMAEAQHLLVAERGYRADEVRASPIAHDAATARALAIDLASAHVVKLDAQRRVRVARRAGRWLDGGELSRLHPDRLSEQDHRIHPLSSRFDAPTLWLFEALAGARGFDGGARRDDFDAVRACRDVREMLDWSHTRGALKGRLMAQLARFVSPVEGARERLWRWRGAGKRLFVVTNSDRPFASAVLDLAVGPDWRELFAVVVTSAAKPRFFDRAAPPSVPPTRESPSADVLEGAHAAVLERRLAASGPNVLYVGDNARADIAAARAFGWKTVHVVAELSAPPDSGGPWGAPFVAGGAPSWFAHDVGHGADLVCDRVDRLWVLEPDQRLEPAPTASGESA